MNDTGNTAQTADLRLDRPLVFFDIESTGTSPRNDRIIELAAIRLSPDGTEESRTWRVNPGMPIPPESTEVHGITDADVENLPGFAMVAGEVSAFFKDADVAGYNSERFDIPMLEEEFLRCGMAFDMDGRRSVDVQKIFFKREPRDLSAALRFYCGREHKGAHGAAADARATLDVFRGQLRRYWIRGELCVNFGRRKGTSLKELARTDRNYLKWIVAGDFPAEARLVCKRLLDGEPLPPPPPGASQPAQPAKKNAEGQPPRPRSFKPRQTVAAEFNTSLADAFGTVFGK